MFDTLLGNEPIVTPIRRMLAENRLPQTLLFAGPEGVGKATLARLIAAAFNCKRRGPGGACGECSSCTRILAADLALLDYQKLLDERTRMAPDKRRDNPLVISTHPDFLTFPPDGPLAQISIEQVRRLKEHAQFPASEGGRRVFLIDHGDRIDLPAANSLLKTLEEPPAYLTLILTAVNAFDLLPTIRSRSVPFHFAPIGAAEMDRFLKGRPEIAPADRPKVAVWATGSPGRALSINIASYEKRRQAMLALLQAALGAPFGEVLRHTEALARSKQERLELLLDMLYRLLRDIMQLSQEGSFHAPLINEDIRAQLAGLAAVVNFEWLERALEHADGLERLARRNIQKQIALEAFAVGLRRRTAGAGP